MPPDIRPARAPANDHDPNAAAKRGTAEAEGRAEREARGPGVAPRAAAEIDAALDELRRALRDLAYGTITITVHDGAIVQIDRTEKLRLDRAARRRAP